MLDGDLRILVFALLVNLAAAAVIAAPIYYVFQWTAAWPDWAVVPLGLLATVWLLAVFYHANMNVLRRLVGD